MARADTNLGASDFDSIKQLFRWLLAALVSRGSDELRCKLPGLLEPLPVEAGAVQQLKVTVRLGAAKAESSRVLHEPCMFHAECRLPGFPLLARMRQVTGSAGPEFALQLVGTDQDDVSARRGKEACRFSVLPVSRTCT